MRVTVVSLHPLYDGRIAKHLRLLNEAGWQITYLNQSCSAAEEQLTRLKHVRLIQRRASASFGGNLLRYAACLLWFAVRLIISRPRLVHIHDLLLLPLVLPARCLPGCKVVFDVHEYYLRMEGTIGRVARLYYRWLVPLVHGLVGVAEDIFPPADCPRVVVPNYQDRRDYPPASCTKDSLCSLPATASDSEPAEKHPEEQPEIRGKEKCFGTRRRVRFVYFGSLSTEHRDVALLLDVVEGLLQRFPGISGSIAGQLHGAGSEIFRQHLERLQRNFPGRFVWHGVLSRSDVLRQTAKADIGFLFHLAESHNYCGSSPNKIFEYLAVGAAIVATDGFARSEEIARDGAGLLFPPGVSAETVLAQLQPVFEEPARLAQMKEASWRLGSRYDWSTAAMRYLDLYCTIGVFPKPLTDRQTACGGLVSSSRNRAA